eukprot:s73_g16.t1
MCLQSNATVLAANATVLPLNKPAETTQPVEIVNIEEILATAAVASAEAPNRAVKRRVRQRLHKKLGSLLSAEDFDRAMDRFKDMEQHPPAALPVPTGCNSAAPQALPVGCATQIFAVPMFMSVMAAPPMRLSPVAAPCVARMPEQKLKASAASDETDMSETTADDEMDLESVSDLESEWAKALTEGSSQLPVERTFIQFNTRPHEFSKGHRFSAMCLQTNTALLTTGATVLAAQAPAEKMTQLSEESVEEILHAAAQASLEAPNRAVKRRVRQRLHKKLGSLLSAEEFDRAMDRFKDLEQHAPATPPAESFHAPQNVLPVGCPTQLIAVPCPFFMPVMAPAMRPSPTMMPCMQVVNQQPRKQEPVATAVHIVPEKAPVWDTSAMSETTADDEMDLESVSDLESEWARALTEGSATLPVERTFIQFNTRPHVHRRRSKSV